MSKARIGIVTVSDRASAGIYEDLSGKAIIDTLNAYLTSEWEPVYQVIPDEQDQIEATLVRLVDDEQCCRECLDAVFPAIPYCIDLMEGPYLECDEAIIKPFRPKK